MPILGPMSQSLTLEVRSEAHHARMEQLVEQAERAAAADADAQRREDGRTAQEEILRLRQIIGEGGGGL